MPDAPTAFETLRMLFVEQTTPDEVIVFLISCILIAFLVAFLLYGLILAVLWRVRLREVTTFRALFFPRRDQLARHLGEYLVAASTSVLLTLTVAARHDAVQTVLDYPLYRVDAETIQQAFPFGDVGREELMAGGADTGELATRLSDLAEGRPPAEDAGLPSIGVEALLLPTVVAGGPDNATLWLRAIVGRLEENPWSRFPNDRHLLGLSIVLLVGYAGWFAFGRSRKVESSGGKVETDYARVAGRLLVPAVCTALLLVSAAAAADPDRISRSAVAAAGFGLGAEGARAALLFESAMSNQLARGQLVRHLVAGTDSVPSTLGAIDRLDASLQEVQQVATQLAVVDGEARRRLDALRAELTAVGARFAALEGRLAEDAATAAGERARIEARAERAERLASGVESRLAAVGAQVAETRSLAIGAADDAAAAERTALTLATRLQAIADRLPSTGLLLVDSPQLPYEVRRSAEGSAVASGAGVGLHALPPGEYWVTNRIGTRRISVVLRGAHTVRIERVVAAPPERSDPPPVIQ